MTLIDIASSTDCQEINKAFGGGKVAACSFPAGSCGFHAVPPRWVVSTTGLLRKTDRHLSGQHTETNAPHPLRVPLSCLCISPYRTTPKLLLSYKQFQKAYESIAINTGNKDVKKNEFLVTSRKLFRLYKLFTVYRNFRGREELQLIPTSCKLSRGPVVYIF